MSARLTTLKPHHVADLIRQGDTILIDIRDPDEFARKRIAGAQSQPLLELIDKGLKASPEQQIVFTCRSGMRTAANNERLGQLARGRAFILEGGVDAWAAAGLPVASDPRAPLEMVRQVQLGAGGLVLLGTVLGLMVSPLFFGVPIFVGAGLMLAGATGFCGMARVLALMPWNRRAG